MVIINFYDRKKEIELLNRVKKPFFCVIYGRRRVGKTSLILHYLQNLKDKEFLYFYVNPRKSENLLLEEYTNLLKEKKVIESFVRPNTWEEFFKILFENFKGVIAFDEFQWFLDVNKEVPFILQKYWDLYSNPSIMISGSVIGLIKKLFLDEGAPLYKRADININLKPLNIETCFQILKDIGITNLEEKFKFYLLFGGMPYYYNLLIKYRIKRVFDAIEILVLDENGPLRNEVREVLMESFGKNYKTYLSMLFAISEGKTKIEEIASASGIKATSIMPYIYDLIDLLGLLDKQRIGLKKKFIYEIKDSFHRFWLNYVYRYSTKMNMNSESVLALIKNDINIFFGLGFERLSQDFVRKYFSFPRVMKYIGFTRKDGKRSPFDIDVLALNEKTKQILFGECKWKNKVNAKSIAKQLDEKTEYVKWHNDERKETLVIFAKSFSKKINEFEGRKVYCYDLKDLGKLLKDKKNQKL